MANEIKLQTSTGANAKAVIRNAIGQVWKTTTSAFVTFSAADINNYAVALTEQDGSGFYVGSFPNSITAAGQYSIVVYDQAGGSLLVTDTEIGLGSIDWDGSGEVTDDGGDDLITNAYAVNFLPVGVSDDLVTVLVKAASAAVRTYCRNQFTASSAADFYTLHQPTRTLVLKRFPITALTKVTLWPFDSIVQEIDGSEYKIDTESGMIQLKYGSSACPMFPSGFQNVKVEYTSGGDVPADVELATAFLVRNVFNLGTQEVDGTMVMEDIGDYQYQLNTSMKSLLVSNEVRDLLSGYRDALVV